MKRFSDPAPCIYPAIAEPCKIATRDILWWSTFTARTSDIRRIQNEIVGSTAVNMSLMQIANNYLPFGGVGHSGIGKTNGEAGF